MAESRLGPGCEPKRYPITALLASQSPALRSEWEALGERAGRSEKTGLDRFFRSLQQSFFPYEPSRRPCYTEALEVRGSAHGPRSVRTQNSGSVPCGAGVSPAGLLLQARRLHHKPRDAYTPGRFTDLGP